MESILFIAVGGALGALGRFWTGIAASALFGKRFPFCRRQQRSRFLVL